MELFPRGGFAGETADPGSGFFTGRWPQARKDREMLMSIRKLTVMGLVVLTGLVAWSQPVRAEEEAGAEKPKLNVGGVEGEGGSIKGVVKYTSQVQNSKKMINMSSDKFCNEAHPDGVADQQHRVFGKNGEDNTLQNVFVWVSKGVDPKAAPASTLKPEIDQLGCLYHPRVSGMVAGQTLEIHNSDKTTHNVNMTSRKNGKFNQSQPALSKPVLHEMKKEELGTAVFKCDVHTWMNAYVNVVEHPYFAVTQEDGTFEIHGLPPGEYEISTWHEYKRYKPDQETYQVTVEEDEPAEVVISYASQSSNKAPGAGEAVEEGGGD